METENEGVTIKKQQVIEKQQEKNEGEDEEQREMDDKGEYEGEEEEDSDDLFLGEPLESESWYERTIRSEQESMNVVADIQTDNNYDMRDTSNNDNIFEATHHERDFNSYKGHNNNEGKMKNQNKKKQYHHGNERSKQNNNNSSERSNNKYERVNDNAAQYGYPKGDHHIQHQERTYNPEGRFRNDSQNDHHNQHEKHNNHVRNYDHQSRDNNHRRYSDHQPKDINQGRYSDQKSKVIERRHSMNRRE